MGRPIHDGSFIFVFTRKGKYLVRKLPEGTLLGSSTSLFDAADIALADARNGPSLYIIEQPPIEVDVSKAYGVRPGSSFLLSTPENLYAEGQTATTGFASCDPVDFATSYLWYLNDILANTTSIPETQFIGLSAGVAYSVKVKAKASFGESSLSAAVSFQTTENEAPLWLGAPGTQNLIVGSSLNLNLVTYIEDMSEYTPQFSVASGSLPPGLSLSSAGVVSGTPTSSFSGSITFLLTHAEHPANHSEESAPVTFIVETQDITPPPVPTNFAATSYSADLVHLTWTNPADDTSIPGEYKSGLLGTDIWRSTEKDEGGSWINFAYVTRVLVSAVESESYHAFAQVECGWRIRSVDNAFKKSGYTEILSAGPLLTTLNPPINVSASRDSPLQATLSWEQGDGVTPTGYKVYQAFGISGPWVLVYTGASTSYVASSTGSGSNPNFSNSQTPYFYVTATKDGNESVASAIVAATSGQLTSLWQNSFDFPSFPAGGMKQYALSSHDAYDPAYNNPCETSTVRVRYPVGDNGEMARSMRVHLVQHKYGTNQWPTGAAAYSQSLMGPGNWVHKNGASANANAAHRNEVIFDPGTGMDSIERGVEYWMGWSMFYPGPNDPYGDPEFKPLSFQGGWSDGPQLHPVNMTTAEYALYGPLSASSSSGGFNPALALKQMAINRNVTGANVNAYPVIAGAPVVRYKRGSDQVTLGTPSSFISGASSAAHTLSVEWDSVPGAAKYRVYRAVRAEGPYQQLGSDILAAETTGMRYDQTTVTRSGTVRTYQETKLGTWQSKIMSASYICIAPVDANGVEGPWSLPCPSRRSCFGMQIYGIHYSAPLLPNTEWPYANYNKVNSDYQSSTFGGIEGWDLRGHWIDFVLRYKLSDNYDGYFQLWVNDELVAEQFNILIGRFDTAEIRGQPPRMYWRLGMYHGWPNYSDHMVDSNGNPTTASGDGQEVPADWPAACVIYYDEFHLAKRINGPSGAVTSADPAYDLVKPRGVRT
ncbi:MAG: hypothetical protein DA330_00975 [Nitrososphaera sp.]|nr:hypothetical protein [Nitrososphaera sp.]